MLTTGQERKITYWNLQHPNPVRMIDTSRNPQTADECMSLSFSNNGKYFVTGGSEQAIKIWDAVSGKLISEGRGHSGCVNTVTFSADDRQVISGGRDGNIFVWNIFD